MGRHTSSLHALSVAALLFWAATAGLAAPTQYDLLVAQDGSGDYTTVQAAIKASAHRKPSQRVIYIKAGVYKEKVVEPTNDVVLVGEDAKRTVIAYDDYYTRPNAAGRALGTDESATFYVYGSDFTAYNLTFANTSDSGVQAVAVWTQGDRGRFFGCRFLGYHDTLYASHRKQYFKDCYIAGAVDFIFGSATAVFDRCTIDSIDSGYVTAASTPDKKQFGFVFKNCTIVGDAEAGSVYLGRPWTAGAAVVFIGCSMGGHIHPNGWDNWDNPALEATAYFGEYGNGGVGASLSRRVRWSHKLTDQEAAAYTLKNIYKINGAQPDSAGLWYKDT